jgi:hypothetical protein
VHVTIKATKKREFEGFSWYTGIQRLGLTTVVETAKTYRIKKLDTVAFDGKE